MKTAVSYLLVIMIIILFSGNCFSSEGLAWDVTHVTGTCIGTLYLTKVCHMSHWKSAVTMFALGVCWEYFGDEFYRRGYYNERFKLVFDRRGFQKQDLFRNGIGIAISFPIR